MARVKGAMSTRKRHKKILKLAKGFRGSRSRLFKTQMKGHEIIDP